MHENTGRWRVSQKEREREHRAHEVNRSVYCRSKVVLGLKRVGKDRETKIGRQRQGTQTRGKNKKGQGKVKG